MDNNEEVLSKLKFIGFIEKDEKLNIRYMTKHPNDWRTTLSRSFIYPDNRNNSLNFVRNVISRSFEIIEHNHTKNVQLCRAITTDLERSKKGLQNLKYTYSDDTKFCCDLDVLYEKIVTHLSVLKEAHPDIFSNEHHVDL